MKLLKKILILFLLVNTGFLSAQETVEIPDTTQTDSKLLKILVKAKEMIDLYNSVVTPELLDEIDKFKTRKNINIYAKPILNDSTFFAQVLNGLVNTKYSQIQSPALTFNISLIRQSQDRSKFTANIQAVGTPNMQESAHFLNTTILETLNAQLQNGFRASEGKSIAQALVDALKSLFGAEQIPMNVPNFVQFAPKEALPNIPVYGFDNAFLQEFINEYEKINVNKQDYNVAWKSIETNQTDFVKVSFIPTNDTVIAGFTTDSILFRSNNTKTIIPISIQGDDTLLQIQGSSVESEDYIDAFFKLHSDSGKTQEVLVGQLGIISYDLQNKEVVLVSVNGAITPSQNTIQNYLNNIYKQAVTDYTVSSINLNISSLPNPFDNTDNDDRLNYTTDMSVVIDALKNQPDIYDNSKYYLFYVDNPTNTSIGGYMPYKKHFGFIFDSSNRTIAHELGHGAFRLRHTFVDFPSLTQTDNLMDYGTGTNLYKYQWDYIHNPQWTFNWLHDESEGEYSSDGHYYTVQLVALLMGYGSNIARQLGVASEYPDTHVKSEIDMQEMDSWIQPKLQQRFHALTGGFHGVELAITAYALTKTHKNQSSYYFLYHRFGDCFAHFDIENDSKGCSQINLKDYINAIDTYISSKFIFVSDDYRVSTPYGLKPISVLGGYNVTVTGKIETNENRGVLETEFIDFLLNAERTIVGSIITSQTSFAHLSLTRHYEGILELLPTAIQNNNIMYGSNFQIDCFTDGHVSDGTLPDNILEREEMYFVYIGALVDLFSIKVTGSINESKKHNIVNKFKDIIDVIKYTNITRLDGIFSYEIAKIQNAGNNGGFNFYIPVKYIINEDLSTLGVIINWTSQAKNEEFDEFINNGVNAQLDFSNLDEKSKEITENTFIYLDKAGV